MANISAIKLPDGVTYDIVDRVSGSDIVWFDYYEDYPSRPQPIYIDIRTAYNAGKTVFLHVIWGQEDGSFLIPLTQINYEGSYALFSKVEGSTKTNYEVSTSGTTKAVISTSTKVQIVRW